MCSTSNYNIEQQQQHDESLVTRRPHHNTLLGNPCIHSWDFQLAYADAKRKTSDTLKAINSVVIQRMEVLNETRCHSEATFDSYSENRVICLG